MKIYSLHYLFHRTVGAFFMFALLAFNATADTKTDKPLSSMQKIAKANGIELPKNYNDWRVISISHRTDNQTLRVILGNDIAIKAVRSQQTNPWPDGSIIGKMVWKQTEKTTWPSAIIPDKFVHAEFMFKEATKFKDNGTGWGWARWLGEEQKPYGNEKDHDQSCITCHTPVKNNDWVFTTPAIMP